VSHQHRVPLPGERLWGGGHVGQPAESASYFADFGGF
jgi:hypothetical protein